MVRKKPLSKLKSSSMPMICAAFGIRASATRGVRARGARDERDATSFRVAKTRRRRPFARTTNDERHARRRISLERNARVDGGENAKPSSTRSSREKKKTRLSCTVCEKAFPSMWRSPPSVARVLTSRRAAERGERRDRDVRVFARRRVGNFARGSSRRRPRLAAPIEGGADFIARLFESASDATRFRARGSRRGDAPSVRTKHARDG